jgi:hypothetical protein
MATIIVTEAARANVREFLTRVSLKRPVLSVHLDRWGLHDNRRGPKGEVVWITIRQAGWRAGVSEWEGMPEELTRRHSISLASWGELEIALSSEVEEFAGQLTVDYSDDDLRVEAVPL